MDFFKTFCVFVFFISTFVPVHIVVLLILFTILNYIIALPHIILRVNYYLICSAY